MQLVAIENSFRLFPHISYSGTLLINVKTHTGVLALDLDNL